MPGCRVRIQAANGAGQVSLTVAQALDEGPVLAADSVPLTARELGQFFAALDPVDLLRLDPHPRPGTDGVTVYNTVARDSQQNAFHFWSPGPQTPEHRVVEAVLGVVRRKFPARQHQEYVEDLEQYFAFPLPCKITRRAPFEARMYGTIAMRQQDTLARFVEGLPSDQPLLLDVSNFHLDFGYCYPLFKALLQRNARVVWVTAPASCWNEQALQEIGVAPGLIAPSLGAGRQRAHALFGSPL
ncbi:hypothetical protein GCM10028822_34320 [Hymenobacter terrigena]